MDDLIPLASKSYFNHTLRNSTAATNASNHDGELIQSSTTVALSSVDHSPSHEYNPNQNPGHGSNLYVVSSPKSFFLSNLANINDLFGVDSEDEYNSSDNDNSDCNQDFTDSNLNNGLLIRNTPKEILEELQVEREALLNVRKEFQNQLNKLRVEEVVLTDIHTNLVNPPHLNENVDSSNPKSPNNNSLAPLHLHTLPNYHKTFDDDSKSPPSLDSPEKSPIATRAVSSEDEDDCLSILSDDDGSGFYEDVNQKMGVICEDDSSERGGRLRLGRINDEFVSDVDMLSGEGCGSGEDEDEVDEEDDESHQAMSDILKRYKKK